MKLILLSLFVFLSYALYAQKPDKAYYNYKWDIFGGTETYLVPADSGYYLIRNFKGMLAFYSFDTLKNINGNFVNNDTEIGFYKNRLILKSLKAEGKPIKLKVKEYDPCHSYINQNVNLIYAWLLKNEVEKVAEVSLGADNPQWLNRKKHEIEPYNSAIYRSKNSVFGKTCFLQFKLVADSVHKSNLAFIEKLKVNNQN
jgi:hypothetical protein